MSVIPLALLRYIYIISCFNVKSIYIITAYIILRILFSLCFAIKFKSKINTFDIQKYNCLTNNTTTNNANTTNNTPSNTSNYNPILDEKTSSIEMIPIQSNDIVSTGNTTSNENISQVTIKTEKISYWKKLSDLVWYKPDLSRYHSFHTVVNSSQEVERNHKGNILRNHIKYILLYIRIYTIITYKI